MRGKLQKNEYGDDILGITPADAGKTSLKYCRWKEEQDHPRGCGENAGASRTVGYPTGSPPRMRGKRATDELTQDETRITPADAGKTRLELHENKLDKDHPRGCGENFEKRLTR